MCNSGCYSIECTGSKALWNNVQCIILTLREVSCIIKLEDELLLNSQTLKILQGVSHELKTPLNQIINEHKEILRSNQDIPHEVQTHITKSLHLSTYLLSSIQDMIDYSHIKFKNLRLNYAWMNTNETILQTTRILKDMNNSCIIKFCNDTSERLNIYTDKGRFKQCLLSLASISLGYFLYRTVEHSSTIIHLHQMDNNITISISFNSIENYLMPPKPTLVYLSKSLKMKITKNLQTNCAEIVLL